MSHGDLMQLITTEVEDNDVWDILKQVIQGLKYLHEYDIVHGYLADFVLSKKIVGNKQQKESVGFPAFITLGSLS